MKKFIISIIVLVASFSIPNGVFAMWNGGYLEDLLEIPSGVEAFDISLAELDTHYFQTAAIQNVYNNFASVDRVLRDELINKYRNGDFEYYQMQGIIKNYKDFVYHTNKLFQYLSIKDNGISGKSIDTAILRSYQNVRISYTRMRNIIARNY